MHQLTSKPKNFKQALILTIIGLGSIAWLLIRSIPKPSRLTYPCQRIAFINSLALIFWIASIISGNLLYRNTKSLIKKFFLISIGIILIISVFHTYNIKTVPVYIFGQTANSQVVWITNPNATTTYAQSWANKANASMVNSMLDDAIKTLTGQATVKAAWTSLFTNHNHGADYIQGELIAIKVNNNNSYDCDNSGCPIYQVTNALLRQLINEKGVPAANITIYDTSRGLNDYFVAGVTAAFPGVILTEPESCTNNSSVLNAPFGCALANAKYLINLPLLRVHGGAGVSLAFKNHLGSTSIPSNFHGRFFDTNASTNSLVQLNRHPFIKDKTILILDDALYGLSVGGPNGYPNITPSSLFLATDPVAIDSVMTDYLTSIGSCITCAGADPRIYMSEAASIGLGNYATSCNGTNCSYTYPNIKVIRCNPSCPSNPTATPVHLPSPTLSPTPTPPTSTKLGDANGDNIVDGRDYVIWLTNYNLPIFQPIPLYGDFDKNGTVDGKDYVIWLNNYNK